MHDRDFSACHASLCIGRMFILCLSYLHHLASKGGHRSGDFLQPANVFTNASPINPGYYTRVHTFDGAHGSCLERVWAPACVPVGQKPDRAPYPSGNICLTSLISNHTILSNPTSQPEVPVHQSYY